MKKAAIFTLCMGREQYLMNLCDSLMGSDPNYMQHFVMFQGTPPSEELCYFIGKLLDLGYPIKFTNAPVNVGIGLGLEKMKETFITDENRHEFDTVIKIDDDCVIRSPDFLDHVSEIRDGFPSLVFSPYPVGLINNAGGPPKVGDHHTWYGEKTDTWYTFRPVVHVGGFCRVSPADLFFDFTFPDDLNEEGSGWEDGHFSRLCMEKNIPMRYLENGLIVEHQESTLGQHMRYGEEYFGKRF